MALADHWRWLEIDRIPDHRGMLSVMELGKQLPFEVRRLYWIDSVPDRRTARGGHAHMGLRQVLFCVSGDCELELTARDGTQEVVRLKRSGPALYLEGRVWRVMRDFSQDCCLMVAADREFDDGDYIRDFDAFRAAD